MSIKLELNAIDAAARAVGKYWAKRRRELAMEAIQACFEEYTRQQTGTFPTVMEDIGPWNRPVQTLTLQSLDIGPEPRCTCGVTAAGVGGIHSDWCDIT